MSAQLGKCAIKPSTPQLPGKSGKPENPRAQGEERLRQTDLIVDHRAD